MPSFIQKMKNAKKDDSKKDESKKEKNDKKYKKSNHKDSGSDTDQGKNNSDSEDGNIESEEQQHKQQQSNEEFDIQEYRKMLAGMFPSKYMANRVNALEKNQTPSSTASADAVACKRDKKSTTTTSTKPDENKKVTRSAARAAQEQKVETKPNEKSKKKHADNPPPPSSDEDNNSEASTSSTSTTCSDDESGDGEYSSGFDEFAKEQLKSGKFNIVINLVSDKHKSNKGGGGGDGDDDSQWKTDDESDDDEDGDDDDDSEYDPEYDSEYDSEEDEESEYDDEEEICEDKYGKTLANTNSGSGSGSKTKNPYHLPAYTPTSISTSARGKSRKDKVSASKGGKSSSEPEMTPESLETIQTIKKQMEDILKFNKHDRIAHETLNIMLNKEKEYKEREEKKLRTQKRHHLKSFKKLLRKKNSTNDLKYFKENLSTEEQTSVIDELEKLNKLTITDKPYRLALLQSDIPQSFKAIALKKITNLRYMEPGAGEYYKIKNWVDTFMQIPFGTYSNLPLTISDGIEKCHDFMEDAKSKLDGAVYGLNDAKMQIMQMLGQWISNPTAMGTAIAINGPMGTGKCHSYDTSILMYDGSIKMVQDIVVGDKVMGDDSKCRNVISLGRGEDNMFDIIHSNGEKYGVNSEHIMCLKQSGMNIIKTVKTTSGDNRYKVCYFDKNDYKQHSKRFSDLEEAKRYLQDLKLEHDYVEIPVKKLLELPKYIRVNFKGYKRGAEFSSKKVPFDPYIIGVWLGDGTSSKSEITNQDATILHYLRTELKKYNLNLVHRAEYTYGISYDMNKHDTRNNKNKFLQVLKDYKLIRNKHIPDDYKINDRKTRLELLAGIIDTDGSYCDNSKGYDIIQKNKVLADDILFLARSLGFSANMKECEKSCMYKGEKRTGTYYRTHLSGDNLSSIPVKCPRKMAKTDRVINKDSMVMGIKIEPRGWGKYYGFELDNNHKYLLGDFTVTHNTSLVKEGISKILNREFAFVPLGGATDSSYLEGHSYTYLTDTSQNSQVHDKYFAEIDFDLSKCLFIFSYNDPFKVNPILLDRMYKIRTTGYQVKDKIVIAKQYLIPKIRYEVNFKEGDIIIPDSTLNYIIDTYTEKEDGVRNLKRCIEIIYKKLNLYRLVKPGTTLFEKDNTLTVEFPFTVTNDIVSNLIKKDENGVNKSALNMYL